MQSFVYAQKKYPFSYYPRVGLIVELDHGVLKIKSLCSAEKHHLTNFV